MDGSATTSLGRLARPSGALAMVAIDQRESLRGMFAEARGGAIADDTLVRFKESVAEALAPLASAMLFDRIFGRPAFDLAGRVAPSCARIMAADALSQAAGKPVEETDIDTAISPEAERAAGAAALKLLLIWRPGETRARNLDIARRFMEMSRRAGLLGIVEAVVRPAGDATRESLIVDAARALAAVKPDLYKCEVPFQGNESDAAIGEVCAEISATSPCPWVVLSQGVPTDRFANAVAVACRNGASGFLAGRAVWADTVREPDYAAAIRRISVARLKDLVAIVDANVRRQEADAKGGAPRAP
jgi:sulfofructosephosphate aldolase